MPGIDGFDDVPDPQEDLRGRRAPPSSSSRPRARRTTSSWASTPAGVDYLTKPFRPKEVLARIRTHLSNQLLARAAEQGERRQGPVSRDVRPRPAKPPLVDPRAGRAHERERHRRLTDEQREIVHTIHGASQSMLQLVNELLDVATIEAGHLKLAKEPTRDRRHRRAVGPPEQHRGRQEEHADRDGEQDGTNPMVERRPEQDPPGGRQPHQQRGQVLAAGLADHGEDPRGRDPSRASPSATTGPGIPDNERHKLFKDYGRLSAQPTGGEKSTGLGLAICRKIVEAHRGTIGVENIPGRGCEFVVRLPRFK